jgi:hypothetical protein
MVASQSRVIAEQIHRLKTFDGCLLEASRRLLEEELEIVMANPQHIKGAGGEELKRTSLPDPPSPLWPLGGGCYSRTLNTTAQTGIVQSSTVSLGTRENSGVLCVTSVIPKLRACAAMNKSLPPIRVPAFFRWARI